MIWAIWGVVAVALVGAWLVWKRVKRRRRVAEVRHIIEMGFSSVAARKRLLKALWHFHDLWHPSWFGSRKARSFEQGLRDTLKRFEVSPDDQNQGLGDLVEVSIPDDRFNTTVNNLRLRRELRIVVDAVEKTLVLNAPEAAPEPERHYREEKVN